MYQKLWRILLMLAVLVSTYGVFPWTPRAWADAPPQITFIKETVERRAGDLGPVVVLVTKDSQPVAGAVVTATLQIPPWPWVQELTADAQGQVFLDVAGYLPTKAGSVDLGTVALKDAPDVSAEVRITITSTLLEKEGVVVTPPANARAVFPTGMEGLGKGEVVVHIRQAGFTGPVQADYVKCPSLPFEAGVKHCEEAPLGGFFDAHWVADNGGLEPFKLNGPNAPIPAGKKVFLAFRFPKGVPAVAPVMTPGMVELVPVSGTTQTLPLNLYGHQEDWVQKALAPVLAGAKVDVEVQYQRLPNLMGVNPGGLVSLMLDGKMVDLSKPTVVPPGAKIVLGFKVKVGTPVAPVVTPKPIVAKPALPGVTTVKFPAGTYNHGQKDVEAALAKAGLKVGNVAHQKLSQMAGEENEAYWQQTMKGGLLSASYVNAQGQRTFFDLSNPDAPQNQVAPGTVIDLAFRSP